MPFHTVETFYVPGLIEDAGKVAIHLIFGDATVSDADREKILDAVHRVARSGYGHTPFGEVDIASIAETAATRYRSEVL